MEWVRVLHNASDSSIHWVSNKKRIRSQIHRYSKRGNRGLTFGRLNLLFRTANNFCQKDKRKSLVSPRDVP